MIDYIKAKLTDKTAIEKILVENPDKFNTKQKYNCETGTETYPISGNVKNLYMKISSQGATISNSVHKYYNSVKKNKSFNFNDLTIHNIIESLDLIENELSYSLDKTLITNLEFGFNLEIDKDVSLFLEENVLMHNLKEPCYNPKNDNRKKIKKFTYTEYGLKLYNKTLEQSRFKDFKKSLKHTNILRVEIKYTSKKQLSKLGVFNLNDLKKEQIYLNLINNFLEKFNKLLILDNYESISKISKQERLFINNCTNPNYWIKLKKYKSKGTVLNRKKHLEKLIQKHRLDKFKTSLIEKIIDKFYQLAYKNSNQTPLIYTI